MLSTSNINSLDYYSNLAVENYYMAGGEPPGLWAGLGARNINLVGRVGKDDFSAVYQGFSPSGKALCGSSGDKHRPGWDFTFSAPKSVSVLWALSDTTTRQNIQRSQQVAVEQALEFLERHAAVTRRGHAGARLESVVGLTAALFEHSTSRAQDPQLHTHCLIANFAQRHDGTWGTLESRQLYLWQKSAGAVYRLSLASNLRSMGIGIERIEEKDNFEVKGVSTDICRVFSKRTKDIEDVMSELGVNSRSSKIGDLVALTSRSKKENVDRKSLLTSWRNELNELGLNFELDMCLEDGSGEEIREPLSVSGILRKIVEKTSIFRLQDLYAFAATEGQWIDSNSSDIEVAVQELIRSNDVVDLGLDDANNRIFSTPEIIEMENRLVLLADSLQKARSYELSDNVIRAAIREQQDVRGFSLSEEQVEAVFGVCQTKLDILQGAAGAGKSISMTVVKEAYESKGFKVIGASVARQAASQLEHDTGIASRTLAKVLSDLRANRLSLDNTVVVIDEAGQVSVADLVEILNAADHGGGKVVLVGEHHQLGAITHDGSLRYLSGRQGCVRIKNIRRQREDWAREAVMQLRVGDAMTAIKSHEKRGLLYFSENSSDARRQLIEEWLRYSENNPAKESMILALRWKDVQLLNEGVRGYYQEKGLVGNENLRADCIVSNRVMSLSFSTGDRIRFARNDYARNFTNGELGVIEKVGQRGLIVSFLVRCDDGRLVSFSTMDYVNSNGQLYLAHAYASTIYSSQGRTIDGDVFVYYTTGMDRAATYVAGSRHKDSCRWFFNRNELDIVGGAKDRGITFDDDARLAVFAKCASARRERNLAIEYGVGGQSLIGDRGLKVKNVQSNSLGLSEER